MIMIPGIVWAVWLGVIACANHYPSVWIDCFFTGFTNFDHVILLGRFIK